MDVLLLNAPTKMVHRSTQLTNGKRLEVKVLLLRTEKNGVLNCTGMKLMVIG